MPPEKLAFSRCAIIPQSKIKALVALSGDPVIRGAINQLRGEIQLDFTPSREHEREVNSSSKKRKSLSSSSSSKKEEQSSQKTPVGDDNVIEDEELKKMMFLYDPTVSEEVRRHFWETFIGNLIHTFFTFGFVPVAWTKDGSFTPMIPDLTQYSCAQFSTHGCPTHMGFQTMHTSDKNKESGREFCNSLFYISSPDSVVSCTGQLNSKLSSLLDDYRRVEGLSRTFFEMQERASRNVISVEADDRKKADQSGLGQTFLGGREIDPTSVLSGGNTMSFSPEDFVHRQNAVLTSITNNTLFGETLGRDRDAIFEGSSPNPQINLNEFLFMKPGKVCKPVLESRAITSNLLTEENQLLISKICMIFGVPDFYGMKRSGEHTTELINHTFQRSVSNLISFVNKALDDVWSMIVALASGFEVPDRVLILDTMENVHIGKDESNFRGMSPPDFFQKIYPVFFENRDRFGGMEIPRVSSKVVFSEITEFYQLGMFKWEALRSILADHLTVSIDDIPEQQPTTMLELDTAKQMEGGPSSKSKKPKPKPKSTTKSSSSSTKKK